MLLIENNVIIQKYAIHLSFLFYAAHYFAS